MSETQRETYFPKCCRANFFTPIILVPSQLFTPSPLKPDGHLQPLASWFCRVPELVFCSKLQPQAKLKKISERGYLTEQAETVFPFLVSFQQPPLWIWHLPRPEAAKGKPISIVAWLGKLGSNLDLVNVKVLPSQWLYPSPINFTPLTVGHSQTRPRKVSYNINLNKLEMCTQSWTMMNKVTHPTPTNPTKM